MRSAVGDRFADPVRRLCGGWRAHLALIVASVGLVACQPGALTRTSADGEWAATSRNAPPPDGYAATARRGARLFNGEAPLSAHLRGHDHVLPPDALRCSNCHVTGPDPTSPADLATAGTSIADPRTAAPNPRGDVPVALPPRLNRAHLTEPQRRRGGPPSAYTRDSFCQLLRTGVDPASVYTAQTMPVYRLSDADCDAMWLFLMTAGQP